MAALNMLVFHFVTFRDVRRWEHQLTPPVPVKVAGAISLALWTVIVGAGRWIGFVVH